MAAMLVLRKNKIFLLWELSSIFIETMWANFLFFWHQEGGNAINLYARWKNTDSYSDKIEPENPYWAIREQSDCLFTKNVKRALLCYATLCYAMLCYAMLCCAVLYYSMLCYAMLCCAMLYYAMLCCAVLCYTMLCYAMLCCAVLFYAMLCYAMLCYAILCYAMLCCAVLCYAMLCCAMLCYAALCYAMPCYAMLCYAMCHISDTWHTDFARCSLPKSEKICAGIRFKN